jgi:hypothetical protein
MISHPSFSSQLINEDLPAGPQLVFTLNNRFFRHQACYSLLPAKPGGQADRVVSLCKYKVVGENIGHKTDLYLGTGAVLCLTGVLVGLFFINKQATISGGRLPMYLAK